VNAPLDHRRSTADRVLPYRTRADLQVIEVPYDGESTYVLHEPVGGESFHLTVEEFALIETLRGPASLRHLQRVIETQFAPRRATIVELQQFDNRLYEQGLLSSDLAGQGPQLLARERRRRRGQRWSRLLQMLSIELTHVRAGPVVERLYAAFRWAFSRTFLVAACGLVVTATLVAIGGAHELAARLASAGDLIHARYIPIWIAAIAGVKALHELGHALACRHVGARPGQFGVLLLVGAPTLYCDVSDVWRLADKRRRMLVSAAGILVELVVAAGALLVWRYAEPGAASAISLMLVVVCSAGTLAVNANPLLRYDGYYLLSDWLEVPNLAERARGLMGHAARRWLLDEPPVQDALLGPRKRRALWAYAILSKVYVALLLSGLFMLALRAARPHHLQNLVYMLAAISLAGLAAPAGLGVVRMASDPSVRRRFRGRRLGTAVVTLGALAAGALALPVGRRIDAPSMLTPAKAHALFAETGGALEYVAPLGAMVRAGDVVARLRNPAVELACVQQQGTVRQQRTQVQQLRTLQASQAAAARLLPTAIAELADAEAQLARRQAMVEALVIRAPIAGRVAAPPARKPPLSEADRLRPWAGSPLEVRNLGAWIEPGTPLAVIAEPDGWAAWAGVQQADAPAVQPGMAVRLALDGNPMDVLTGRVVAVARRARSNEPDAADHCQGAGPPQEPWYHVVQIELDASATPLFAGARGVARISAERTTLGGLVANELRRTFQRVF
jgi:putative peptide zinc metalloprotease protein